MRIPGNIYQNAQISTRTDRAQQTDRADDNTKANAARPSQSTDVTVAVSSKAKVLASEGAMDMAKVERLRAAIEGGTFAIGYEAIAAKLVETGG